MKPTFATRKKKCLKARGHDCQNGGGLRLSLSGNIQGGSRKFLGDFKRHSGSQILKLIKQVNVLRLKPKFTTTTTRSLTQSVKGESSESVGYTMDCFAGISIGNMSLTVCATPEVARKRTKQGDSRMPRT